MVEWARTTLAASAEARRKLDQALVALGEKKALAEGMEVLRRMARHGGDHDNRLGRGRNSALPPPTTWGGRVVIRHVAPRRRCVSPRRIEASRTDLHP
jgi:hypothetical protein